MAQRGGRGKIKIIKNKFMSKYRKQEAIDKIPDGMDVAFYYKNYYKLEEDLKQHVVRMHPGCISFEYFKYMQDAYKKRTSDMIIKSSGIKKGLKFEFKEYSGKLRTFIVTGVDTINNKKYLRWEPGFTVSALTKTGKIDNRIQTDQEFDALMILNIDMPSQIPLMKTCYYSY